MSKGNKIRLWVESGLIIISIIMSLYVIANADTVQPTTDNIKEVKQDTVKVEVKPVPSETIWNNQMLKHGLF